MKKTMLFLAAVFFVLSSGVVYAADVGHTPGLDVKPITPVAPPEEVLERLDAVPIEVLESRGDDTLSDGARTAIATTFGDRSAVAKFPDIRAADIPPGTSARIAFEVKKDDLRAALGMGGSGAAADASQISFVLWHANGVAFTTYIYVAPSVATPSERGAARAMAEGDKSFYFADENGDPVINLAGSENVYPVFDVTDGSPEDADGETNGEILIKPAAVIAHASSSGGDSGGGCDAGFSGAALLAAAGVWFLSRKRGA